MCELASEGGGWFKRVEGGEHIKMITHRKTAAFMVFLYFLKVFIIEVKSNMSDGKCTLIGK